MEMSTLFFCSLLKCDALHIVDPVKLISFKENKIRLQDYLFTYCLEKTQSVEYETKDTNFLTTLELDVVYSYFCIESSDNRFYISMKSQPNGKTLIDVFKVLGSEYVKN